jgi:hypothetical protein
MRIFGLFFTASLVFALPAWENNNQVVSHGASLAPGTPRDLMARVVAPAL